MNERNGKILKGIGIAATISIVTALLLVGRGWGTLKTEVSHTQERVEEIRTENIEKDSMQDIMIENNKEQTIRTEERLKSIDAGIKRIEKKLEE